MFSQESTGLPASPEVERFFRLLAEVGLIQQSLMEETRRLRARVQELEAQTGFPDHREGRQP